eukprot:TRINITY_DN71194_c0_g1_i1.p1 TRINITY_DN71194_c0_g1~~TRINITY_DN71194_c0_g1_i1.p1  ORF type:complete len:163 (+),score=21.98 TRINITY_DN71194_c0_g1_i1:121-609(+)
MRVRKSGARPIALLHLAFPIVALCAVGKKRVDEHPPPVVGKVEVISGITAAGLPLTVILAVHSEYHFTVACVGGACLVFVISCFLCITARGHIFDPKQLEEYELRKKQKEEENLPFHVQVLRRRRQASHGDPGNPPETAEDGKDMYTTPESIKNAGADKYIN